MALRTFFRKDEIPADLRQFFEPARNVHPTVKSVSLCVWLASLLLPPDSVKPRRILVPFAGSGSEMIGALLAGWDEVIGIEQDAAYVTIAEARLTWWQRQIERTGLRDPAAILEDVFGSAPDVTQAELEQAGQISLFADHAA